MKPVSPDSRSPTPPEGVSGGVEERAEGGQGGQTVVQELWFIVVMTGIALLLLALALGVVLHKVRAVPRVNVEGDGHRTERYRTGRHDGPFEVRKTGGQYVVKRLTFIVFVGRTQVFFFCVRP